ncbi:MAG: SDR family oxidoreductase [Sandarakinorhabdus sp.]|nr:SDR family oxidoreductase [Sandarakinorhabdus sp.]
MKARDRVVVVTGAASGIGLGIARRFAANGHPVALLDRTADAVERETAALAGAGARVLGLVADVADRAQVEAAFGQVRERLAPVAILIANAGISGPADFLTMPVAVWERMIAINLTGVFHSAQLALPDMVAAGWGRIVTIASHAGQAGAPGRAHYVAAKAGVIGLTKALAQDFARHGITVNSIPPSLVDTPMARGEEATGENPPVELIARMVPVGRAGTPDDIADACEFLCSDKAGYITGQQINVNGGMYM